MEVMMHAVDSRTSAGGGGSRGEISCWQPQWRGELSKNGQQQHMHVHTNTTLQHDQPVAGAAL